MPSSEKTVRRALIGLIKAGCTLVTMNALILPVCGMWGPTQRSTIGPQRYTVVDVPSGIFDWMRYCLYLLYCRGRQEINLLARSTRQRVTYREHLKKSLLRDHQSLELLLLLDRHVGELLKSRIIGVHDRSVNQYA